MIRILRREEALAIRLSTQRLAGPGFKSPEEATRFTVATQSQDFGNAKWSVGQRCTTCTDDHVQAAFDAGRILRTHVLRPTWHFIDPADIRWLLALTSPHVQRLNASTYRKLGLGTRDFLKAISVLERELSGNNYQTRNELSAHFDKAGLPTEGLNLIALVMHAELEGVICSGPLRGKQHTYAVLDERIQPGQDRTNDEALAELTLRFFASHGPATDREYARWSGFNLGTAREGIRLVESKLERVEIDDLPHWLGPQQSTDGTIPSLAYLLPEYDECYLTYPTVNFPDSVLDAGPVGRPGKFFRPVIIQGERVGTWKRTIKSKSATLELALFRELPTVQRRLLDTSVEEYQQFIGLPVTVNLHVAAL